MENTVAGEAYIFYIAILGGVLTGVVFDLFRAFRKQHSASVGFVAFQDILFWLITAGIVFALLLKYNYGEPRFFIFIGIMLGGILYHATVSRYVVLIFAKIYFVILTAFIFLLKILLIPIKILGVPIRFVVISLAKTNKKIAHILCRFKDNLKKTRKLLKMY